MKRHFYKRGCSPHRGVCVCVCVCNKKLFKEGYRSHSCALQRLKSSYAGTPACSIASLQRLLRRAVQTCNHLFPPLQWQPNTNRAMKTISSIKGDKTAIRSKRLELPKSPSAAQKSGRNVLFLQQSKGVCEQHPGGQLLIYATWFPRRLTSGIHKAQLTWTHLVPLRVGLRAPPLLGQRRHLGWTPRAQVRHSQFPRGTFKMP